VASAVEEFQGDSGLAVDGVVGPATRGALGGDGPEPPTLKHGSHGWALSVHAAGQTLASVCGVPGPGGS
jgi:peptidoglycan hydrolase-like protein with peptidoglycan-binding domain